MTHPLRWHDVPADVAAEVNCTPSSGMAWRATPRVGAVADDTYADYRRWWSERFAEVQAQFTRAYEALAARIEGAPETYRAQVERGLKALSSVHETLSDVEATIASRPDLQRRFGDALADQQDAYMRLSSGALQDARVETMVRMDGLGPSFDVGALPAVPVVIWVLGAGLTAGGAAWIVDSVAEAEAALADAEALEKCVTAAMMGAELPGRCDAYAPPEPGWGDEVAKCLVPPRSTGGVS
jgi:hypothetical protein